MFYTVLLALATISLVTSGPINILRTESDAHMDETVYVPYDVEYVSVQVPIPTARLSAAGAESPSKVSESNTGSTQKPILLDEKTFKALQNFKTVGEKAADETVKTSLLSKATSSKHIEDPEADLGTESKTKHADDRADSFDLFEDKFNEDLSKFSENILLVPVSVYAQLKGDSEPVNSSPKSHTVAKRQAPRNYYVYRPLVQVRRVFRDRRRIQRPPAYVNYLNDYDNFPTVAV